MSDGVEQRPEVGQHLDRVHLDAGLDEALGAQLFEHLLGVALQGEPGEPSDRFRGAVRQPVDGAEVDHAEPAVREQPEVARVRIGVQQTGQDRPREQEVGEQPGAGVALLRGAPLHDRRQGQTVHPLGHQDPLAARDDRRDAETLLGEMREQIEAEAALITETQETPIAAIGGTA